MFLCAAPSAAEGGRWVRQAQNVCFSAAERLDSDLFQSQQTGFVAGVRFHFLSGGVSCAATSPLTKFGCDTSAEFLATLVVSEAKDVVMYPSPVTEDITHFGFSDTSIRGYTMRRIDDDILTLIQPVYSVQLGETFRVMYTEVFNDASVSDNRGTSCVSVDFLVLSCGHHENAPDHNETLLSEDAGEASVVDVLLQ